MKKAVMLFANGYEEVEALMTVDLLKRAGVAWRKLRGAGAFDRDL